MTNKRLLCFLFIINIFFVLSGVCFAQSITWQRIYRNPLGNDAGGFDICQPDSNNFVIVGLASGTIPSFYVLKINPYSDTLWTKVFGLGGIANAVTASGDGGCVFTGDYGNAFSIKMDTDGNIVWLKDYNGGRGFDIKKTSDGGYIICGDKTSGFQFKGYVCKTDSLGNLQWEREYYDGQTVYLFTIDEAIDGNGYVIGGTKDSTNGRIRGYFFKINNNGDVLWEKTYSLGIDTYLDSFDKKNQGYVFAGNVYTHSNFDSSRAFVFKTDLNGNLTSLKIFTSTKRQSITRFCSQNYNKFFLSFFTFNTSPPGYGTQIFSLDSNFNTIKQLTLLPDSNSLTLYSLYSIPNSTDIIGCGSNDQRQFASLDAYAVRLDNALYPPPPIGIKPVSNTIPDTYKLFQNFPNPFNPKTTITFDLPKDIEVRLTVYDVLGREIYSINEFRRSGFNKIEFDGSNLASGVYYYSLEVRQAGSLTGTFAETRKMVLIK